MAQGQTNAITVPLELGFHELHSLNATIPLTSITVALTEEGNTVITGNDGDGDHDAIASLIIPTEAMDEIAAKWWKLRHPERLITVPLKEGTQIQYSLPFPISNIIVTLVEQGHAEIRSEQDDENEESFIIPTEAMDDLATRWWQLRYPDLLVFLLKLHSQPDVNGRIEYTMALPQAEVEGNQLMTSGNGSSAQQVFTAFCHMALVASQSVMAE